MEARSDWRRDISVGEEKDVINIEREMRGNSKGDVSNAIEMRKRRTPE